MTNPDIPRLAIQYLQTEHPSAPPDYDNYTHLTIALQRETPTEHTEHGQWTITIDAAWNSPGISTITSTAISLNNLIAHTTPHPKPPNLRILQK